MINRTNMLKTIKEKVGSRANGKIKLKFKSFYPLIKEFNRKKEKLQSLGIECQAIEPNWYWASSEYSSSTARNLYTSNGDVNYYSKYYGNYVRAFVAF